MISHLGYDEDLYSIQSKPVILSVQSEHPYDISDQILTAEINENSWQTYMHYMGNVAIDEDNLQIRKISHSNGCSLMAINLNSYLVQVSINMTEAQNIECNSSLITSFNLEAYKCKIFQHLQCERNKQEYKYPFTYTISPGEL